MPVRTFHCSSGHTYDRRVPLDEMDQVCPISRCYAPARAQSVYAIHQTKPKFWGGEPPRQAKEARDEYLAHAEGVRAGLTDEEGNGWSPDFQPKTF